MLGLRHVALLVEDVDRTLAFYTRAFGMRLEWRPDPDNAYLTGGTDNLALHRGPVQRGSNLDHFGFLVPTADAVDAWEARLRALGHPPEAPARTHRDGARSLYVRDPDGHLVQVLYHPPISGR
jgi:catechol 2,3-dioxygenase-like lactoylglutathione lyase family enzyme